MNSLLSISDTSVSNIVVYTAMNDLFRVICCSSAVFLV